MQIVSVGIDLGKTTFHLVALGVAGKVLVRKRFTQKQLLAYTANMQGQFLKKSRHTAKRFEISLHYTQVISIPGAGPIQCEIDG